MKTVFNIFRDDLKKLAKSKVAIIIILGVIFIPGIYAWLNIDSNWNPYNNTGNIPIAVVNEDIGTTILGEDFNMGDKITKSLEQNDAMKWIITDRATAIQNVEQSKYYGAIIIPEDFSQDLTTILENNELKKPTFDFYVNNKKNPIAPIIVSKAANTVKDSVNQTFIETLIGKITSATKALGLLTKGTDDTNSLIAKLENAKSEIEQVRAINKTAGLAIDTTGKSLSAIEALMPTLKSFNNNAEQSLGNAKNTLGSLGDASNLSSVQAIVDQISNHIAKLQEIEQLLDNITPSSSHLDDIKAKFHTITEKFSSLHNKNQAMIKTELSNLYQNANNTIDHTANIIQGLNSSLGSIELSMQYTIQALSSGSKLNTSLDTVLVNFESDLDQTISKIEKVTQSEAFEKAFNLLQNDPDTIADFLSSPVEANEIEVYPIANYGSEMAPFYSILACWVGCTILTAILKLEIKSSKLTTKAKNYQKFFGRFMLFGSLSILQGLVIGLGDLALQVQTVNLPLFLFTLMLSSLVFMLIIYALAAAFGKVGQAMSIVIMVLQVAGSGGTFPIELLPRFFQILQPFMPFYPAMNATRETIGGFYQNDYLIYLGMLLCHLVVALIFGLIFSKHTFETKGKLQQQLHETGIIE